MPRNRAQAPAPAPGSQTGDVDHCLSCPYYKRDRMLHPACFRLRLKRTKDVKQHLLARHRPPLYCPTCGSVDFANVEARDGHVRAGECDAPPGGFVPTPGLDSNQVTQLGRRASRKLSKTEQIARPDSPFLGGFIEESVTMLREQWNAHGQDIFEKCAAPLFAHQPHLRQDFHQAACNVVAGLLSSTLAANAGTRSRSAPALNPIPGPVPGNAQVAEGATPQDHGGPLYMNPNDLITSYGADAGWNFDNNDIAPFYPAHPGFDGYV